jgi:TonB-dependent starch-binding outer membrane protein SusC
MMFMRTLTPKWFVLSMLLALSAAICAMAQDVTVSGRVISGEDQSSLPGVNVLVKGSAIGTVTDIDGNYRLTVAGTDAVLIFSSVGFATEEVNVQGRSVINITLMPDITALSEIVVVGYGTQERGIVTGAISSVNMDQVRSLPLTSVEQALQGRVPGVQVVQTGGGLPGGPVQVNIRGIGSINGETPLYVIDGIPVQEGGQNDRGYSFLNNLNPNDIESIDILKDASAAAIYGSRASGGVVLITTKRGKEGPVRVNFDAYYGSQFRGDTYDVLNAQGYAAYLEELHSQPDGLIPPAFANGARPSNENVDWQNELFRSSAPIQNYNLGISGGTQNALVGIGLEYFRQDGIMVNNNFERFSLRANTDFKISKRIKVGETFLLSKTTRNPAEHQGGRRAQEHAIKQSPFVSVLDPSFLGGYGWPDVDEGQDARNPVADQFLYTREEDRYRFFGSIYADWEIVNGLTYRIIAGMDFGYQRNLTYNPEYQQVRRITAFSAINRSASQVFNPLFEQYLTYARTFGDHNISAMAGFSAQSFEFQQVGGSGEQAPPNVISINGTTVNRNPFDGFNETALRSLFGRITYAYKDRYLLTANLRRDESSKLYRGNNPTGIFPSASVGWRISEESFMSNIPVISDMKFRAGYGEVGNQSPLGAYPTDVLLNTNMFYVFGNNQAIQGITQLNLANPDIRWETSKQWDIGIDAGLWSNRLLVTFDYYNRRTDGLIWPAEVPASVGLGPASVNSGEIENQGIEMALTYRKSTGAFQFDMSGNFTTINNKVLSLVNNDLIIKAGSPTDDLTQVSWTQVGQPIGTFYGWVSDGIFRNWDEVYNWAFINQATTGQDLNGDGIPDFDTDRRDATTAVSRTAPGDIKWRDVNGDGRINNDDQVALGSPIPKVIYGFTFNGMYRGFDFQVFLQGVSGNKIFNGAYRWLNDFRQNFNNGVAAADATSYRPDYTASEPRLVRADPNRNILRSSDRYVSDGSFMRLKNLTFGYTFNQAVLDKIKAQRLRVYVTGQNVLTFTNYFGLEPEVGSYESGTARDAGIDRLMYPQPRTWIVGIQMGF